jgi:hypothetical protein
MLGEDRGKGERLVEAERCETGRLRVGGAVVNREADPVGAVNTDGDRPPALAIVLGQLLLGLDEVAEPGILEWRGAGQEPGDVGANLLQAGLDPDDVRVAGRSLVAGTAGLAQEGVARGGPGPGQFEFARQAFRRPEIGPVGVIELDLELVGLRLVALGSRSPGRAVKSTAAPSRRSKSCLRTVIVGMPERLPEISP